MNFSPDQSAAQANYAPAAPVGPSLMTGDVPIPQSDQEAATLIQQSKAAIDANGGISRLAPQMKAHVKAVIAAIEKYQAANPKSPVANQILSAIRSDPALASYL